MEMTLTGRCLLEVGHFGRIDVEECSRLSMLHHPIFHFFAEVHARFPLRECLVSGRKKYDFFMLGHLDAERLYPRLHLLAPCALQQVGTALR